MACHPVVVRARQLVVALLWRPLLAVLAPVTASGLSALPVGRGAVVALDHDSHSDAIAVTVALHRAGHRRVVAAAAADHWFAGRGMAAAGVLLGGAVPMPRRGPAGLALVRRLVADGWVVVLFPQGSRRAEAQRWRRGVGHLALEGVPVVVGRLAGTAELLPRGRALPRPTALSLSLAPALPAEAAGPDPAGRTADRLRAQAQALPLPSARPSWPARTSDRLTRTAVRRGTAVLAVWAFAEATVWPLIPDLALAGMAFAAPHLWRRLTMATALASAAGGALAVAAIGLMGVAWPLPLVTPAMAAHAQMEVADGGASAIAGQPLSGVPYKAYVLSAGRTGADPLAVAGWTVLARGARMAAVAGIAAAAGRALRRVTGTSGWWPVVHLLAVAGGLIAFAVGLALVVGGWSG